MTVPAPDVAAFLAAIEPAARRDDATALCALMASVSDEPVAMWGASMIGFGRYRYRYDSGREGESFRIGFSPRKAALTLYLGDADAVGDGLLARLGKHTTGKGCLYIKRLADIDAAVLRDVIDTALAHHRALYP